MKVALPHKLSQYTAFTAYTTKIRRQEGYYAYTIWLLVNWIGTGSDRDDQIQQTPRSRKLRWLPTKLTTYQIPNMTEESKSKCLRSTYLFTIQYNHGSDYIDQKCDQKCDQKISHTPTSYCLRL